MAEISKDAQFISLDNELRNLRHQREQIRPAIYILLAIFLGVMGLIMPVSIALLMWLFAAASVLAAINSAVRLAKMNQQIADKERAMSHLIDG